MSKHNKIGIKGEQIAKDYLLNKGYLILHNNWRSGKKEIDLIALKNNVLIIVEIKTRTNFDFGFPEEAVTRKKQSFLKSAAAYFIGSHPQYLQIQFDIISILIDGEHVKEIVHFEEAFY